MRDKGVGERERERERERRGIEHELTLRTH